jgi:protein SCO1/2
MKRAETLSVAIACCSIGLIACSSPPRQNDAQTPAPAQSQPQEQPQSQLQRYDLKGKVVSIDKPGKNVTVDHGDIPGFMGAMTMPYPVKDQHLLDNLAPGDQVTAKVVSGSGEVWLENIVKVNTATPAK